MKRSRDEEEETVVVDSDAEDTSSRSGDHEPAPSPPVPTASCPSPSPSSSASFSVSSSPPPDAVAPTTPALASYQLRWQSFGTLLVLDCHSSATARIPGNSRVAAFDMDSTLIAPKSNRRFPLHRGDWRWLHPEVPLKLRQLHCDGWKLVIFTNQRGISTGQTTAATITSKISDIIQHLGCPVQAFVATADDLFRKPATAMWAKFVNDHNDHTAVDLNASTYVGDAAGRQSGWDGDADTRKDHSTADRKFAMNVGIRFATPEPYFLGHKEAAYKLDSLDIASYFTRPPVSKRQKLEDREVEQAASEGEDQVEVDEVRAEERKEHASPKAAVTVISSSTSVSSSSATATVTQTVTDKTITITTAASSSPSSSSPPTAPLHAKSHQELVLFVGIPAAGKSTYARKHFIPHGYDHINQDTLKTRERCIKQARLALASHRSVVVDNTNPAPETRALYISLARAQHIPVRCYHFNTPPQLAAHMNMYRERVTGGVYKHVPRIAFSTYVKNYRKPERSEGLDEIVEVDFVPEFTSEKERKLFEQLS